MTDREKVRALLDDLGVAYLDGPPHSGDPRGVAHIIKVPCSSGDWHLDDAREGTYMRNVGSDRNDGYSGFFTLWEFDAEGGLIKVGAWE